jgi:hypothetical protein
MANVGSAAAGKTLIGNGNGASPTYANIGTNSGLTSKGVVVSQGNGAFQATSAGSAGQVLQSGGASNPAYSTATYPSTAGTSGNVLTSNGTNWTSAAPPASGGVQQVYSQTNSYFQFGVVIPLDDTIPQNTEGTELLTCTITPTSATNVLYIEFNFWGSSTLNRVSIAALFQDSTANALEAQFVGSSLAVGEQAQAGVLRYQMVAGTTSSTTFKIRVGPSGDNMWVNGDSGGRKFGGVGRCTMTVVEYKP